MDAQFLSMGPIFWWMGKNNSARFGSDLSNFTVHFLGNISSAKMHGQVGEWMDLEGKKSEIGERFSQKLAFDQGSNFHKSNLLVTSWKIKMEAKNDGLIFSFELT